MIVGVTTMSSAAHGPVGSGRALELGLLPALGSALGLTLGLAVGLLVTVAAVATGAGEDAAVVLGDDGDDA